MRRVVSFVELMWRLLLLSHIEHMELKGPYSRMANILFMKKEKEVVWILKRIKGQLGRPNRSEFANRFMAM